MDSNLNLLYFDIYSKRASFFYHNHEKIGSYFGLFLTLIYISVSLILFFYYIINTLKRNNIVVYDSTAFTHELPIININSSNFYFAFGLENKDTLNRFIDETIYYPEIVFINRTKVNGEFITNSETILEYEECKEENFGQNFQHLLLRGELQNSYCLKDFNCNLSLMGGFKYEKMSYIRIKIFPCKNTTENNNHCKSQTEIDKILSNGYLSFLIKDIGLNPANFSSPEIPIFRDLYTTIDKRLYRKMILKYGVTEVLTDEGIIWENVKSVNYLQFREVFQSFSFMEEEDYKNGSDICLVQLRLDDTIHIQKRKYTKLSEIFSRIGGYMQLIYTLFSILALFLNKLNTELKIINSIFNFDLEKKKMALKYQSLRDFDSITIPRYNRNLIFSSRRSVRSSRKSSNIDRSQNYIMSSKNISPMFKRSKERKMDDSQSSKLEINKSKNSYMPSLIINNIRKVNNREIVSKNEEAINYSKLMMPKLNLPTISINYNKKESTGNLKKFNEKIDLNLFDYLFRKKNKSIEKKIELYKLGINFYKKRMDLIHVFTLLLITEKILLKKDK